MRRVIIIVCGFIVAFSIIPFVNWAELASVLKQADVRWFLLTLLVYSVNYVLRALRFRLLMTSTVPFTGLVGVAGVHGMLAYLMPVKSGELSFFWLLSRYFKVTFTDSSASLVFARFADMVVLAMVLPVCLWALVDVVPQGLLTAVALYCSAIVLASALVVKLLFSRRIERFLSARKEAGLRFFSGFVERIKQMLKFKRLAVLLFLTIAIWACVYVTLYCVLHSLGYSVSLTQVVLISTIMLPLSLLPINGPANLGAHEVSFVVGLGLFGYDAGVSILMAVASHAMLVLLVIILGAVSFVPMSVCKSIMAGQSGSFQQGNEN